MVIHVEIQLGWEDGGYGGRNLRRKGKVYRRQFMGKVQVHKQKLRAQYCNSASLPTGLQTFTDISNFFHSANAFMEHDLATAGACL